MNQVQANENVWNANEGKLVKNLPFLGWLSKIGTGLLSLFAQLNENTSDDSPEVTQERTLTARMGRESVPECCSLFYDIDNQPEKKCPYEGAESAYTCPEGYSKQFWTCVQGTRIAACAECTKSQSTCWSGPWHCSIWWWVGEEG